MQSSNPVTLRPFEREPELMSRHRTTARGLLVLISFALATGVAVAGAATKPVPRLVFPVVGPVTYTDDFGAPRGTSVHEGNDLVAPRKALAVAAEAGTVKFHTTSARAGCMLYLNGASGTQYLYIHLNNDLGKTNDNKGTCKAGVAFAPGLKPGQRVEAGEHIGYVGDSGDANWAGPHLHFEVHPGGGAPVSPYEYLRKARKLLWSARAGSTVTLSLTGTFVSAEANVLRMKVATLKVLPKGPTVQKVNRVLDLALFSNAVVERADGARLSVARLGRLLPTQKITVWTSPAGTSMEEKVGAPRALISDRILVALR
jgi:Peptidase family M23